MFTFPSTVDKKCSLDNSKGGKLNKILNENLWGMGKPLGYGETSRVWVLRMEWVLWLFLVWLFHTNDVTPQTPGLIKSN
jgi:hypothetical protein